MHHTLFKAEGSEASFPLLMAAVWRGLCLLLSYLWPDLGLPDSTSHLLLSPVQDFLVSSLQLLVQHQPPLHTIQWWLILVLYFFFTISLIIHIISKVVLIFQHVSLPSFPSFSLSLVGRIGVNTEHSLLSPCIKQWLSSSSIYFVSFSIDPYELII